MKYSEAVTGCPATCADPQAPNNCKEEPTEGCECLPGYVLSGTECVPQNQCGCQRDGEYYPVSLSYTTTYSNMTSFFCFTNKRTINRMTKSH
jgi:hypothetical protein